MERHEVKWNEWLKETKSWWKGQEIAGTVWKCLEKAGNGDDNDHDNDNDNDNNDKDNDDDDDYDEESNDSLIVSWYINCS